MKDTKQEELARHVDRLAQYQEAEGLTDAQFSARYGKYVGSTDTWGRRLKPKVFGEVKVEKWLPLVAQLVNQLDGNTEGLEILAGLSMVKYAQTMYERLQGAQNDRKVAMLIGQKGTGKTFALRYLQRKHPGATAFCEMDESCREKKGQIIRRLQKALGCTSHRNPSDQWDIILDYLRGNSVTLLLDETYHGGLLLIKLLKTLVNQTRVKIMLGTYPTEWKRLINGSSEAIQEAQQLLRRTIRPIETRWRDGSPDEDQAQLLVARGLPARLAADLARDFGVRVRTAGSLSALDDAVTMAEQLSDDDRPGEEAMRKALNAVCIGDSDPAGKGWERGAK